MAQIVVEPEMLFDSCDLDRKGYLIPYDLKAVCPQLDDDEINFIFTTLDSDGSGRIDREEFLSGFQDVLCHGEDHGYPGIKKRANVGEVSRKATVVPLVPDMVYDCLTGSNEQMVLANKSIGKTQGKDCTSISETKTAAGLNLPCQDEILQLHELLQSTGTPEILNCFKKIIGHFYKEIQEQRDQNLQLQHIFKSERETYNRRMNEVENEIDQHISEIEQRAREEERKKLTYEREKMRSRLEDKVTELKANIAKMKLLVKRAGNFRNDPTNQVKHKLQNLSQENQALKSKLAKIHFELTHIKSELATVHTVLKSKKEEVSNDSKALFEIARQKNNLQKKLELYDANKKLYETNNSLRKALDQKPIITTVEWDHLAFFKLKLYCFSDSEPVLRYDYLMNDFDCRASTPTADFGESSSPPERTFRIVMCGDAAVGKSALVARIIKNTFSEKLQSTLGVDFHVKVVSVDGKRIAVQLWDTAGQERFRSLCKSYFRRADGAILVYDCTAEGSFLNVRDWIASIKESAIRQIPIMICGNKTDLRDTQFATNVSTADGEAVAAAMGVLFVECSALNGTNAGTALVNLIRNFRASNDFQKLSCGLYPYKFYINNRDVCNTEILETIATGEDQVIQRIVPHHWI
uniref:EF-hand domain-containing protein n=1 Tax=Setaria digitata TaxID=48799 RepID=A0A915PGS5_9BILA